MKYNLLKLTLISLFLMNISLIISTEEHIYDLKKSSLKFLEKEINLKSFLQLPFDFDWRENSKECFDHSEEKFINDKSCEFGYAYALVNALKYKICISSFESIKKNFSVNELIYCDKNSQKCDGAKLKNTLEYAFEYGLTVSECYDSELSKKEFNEIVKEEYLKCNVDKYCLISGNKKSKISNIDSLSASGPIMQEIMINGPVVANIKLYENFYNYSNGIYQETKGNYLGEHAVVLIGWNRNDDGEFWIGRNNFGNNWGESGYFRIPFDYLKDREVYSFKPEI